jgi:hypothetical protein
MTLWFHVPCGAFKRPEAFLEAIESTSESVDDPETLIAAARLGVERRRVPRVDGAQLAPTGRAKCRSCREAIPKQSWRVRLVYFEDGRFEPSGFVHAACVPEYFETTEIVDRAGHFAPDLGAPELAAFRAAIKPDS